MSDIRLKKVESLLMEEIGRLIVLKVIKDPRVTTMLSVTEVQVSKDLAYAKVFVSTFQNEKKLEEGVLALNHAAGFIQGILGKKLRMRLTPKLTFFPDTSIAHGIKMTQIIEGLDP
jgi:ribosome-binding factor A